MNRIRLSLLTALAAICLIGAPSGYAFADPCTDLGGTVVLGECRISTNVGNKSGEFNLTQPLHILSGGRITVPALAGGNSLTINVCAAPATCSFVMDPGAVIAGNVTTAGGISAGIAINATGTMTIGGTGATGAVISSNQSGGSCTGSGRGGAIALTAGGDIVTEAGSVTSANGTPCPGGSITLISSQGTVTHAGLIDLFARGNIAINGDAVLPFSVHANGLGGSGTNGEEGGIITVKTTQGSVTASGLALQATSTAASNATAATPSSRRRWPSRSPGTRRPLRCAATTSAARSGCAHTRARSPGSTAMETLGRPPRAASR